MLYPSDSLITLAIRFHFKVTFSPFFNSVKMESHIEPLLDVTFHTISFFISKDIFHLFLYPPLTAFPLFKKKIKKNHCSSCKTILWRQIVDSHANYCIWMVPWRIKKTAAAKDGGEKTTATGGGQQVLIQLPRSRVFIAEGFFSTCRFLYLFVTRRFAASGSVTAEEQEQRILYTNVLEYEQDHVSLTSCWRTCFFYRPREYVLHFIGYWILYSYYIFCVLCSLGLAQTVESQHKKESWGHLISVRPRVLPAQVSDFSTNFFLLPRGWNWVDKSSNVHSAPSQSDHPVVKLLRKHQYRIYNRLYPIVSKGLPRSPAPSLQSSRSTPSFHRGGLLLHLCLLITLIEE